MRVALGITLVSGYFKECIGIMPHGRYDKDEQEEGTEDQ